MRRLIFIPLILLAAAIMACDVEPPLPAPLALTVAPAPGNFTVSTTDSITYELSWTISAPTTVSLYKVYTSVVILGIPVVDVDTTTATSYTANLGLKVPEAPIFGVSSVSVDNVESDVVSKPGY